MTIPCKYRTAHSEAEVREIFKLEGIDIDSLGVQFGEPQPVEPSELDDTDEVFPRQCQMCKSGFFVTAAMQAATEPDSPFNICRGCLNRLLVQDELISIPELSKHFARLF